MQSGGLVPGRSEGGTRLGIQLSAFLLAFDASANGYVIQYWQERLGFGARLASWFLGAYILGELAGAPLGGYLAARWGAARAFRRATVLFALGALFSAGNWSLTLALFGRVLQGLAAGPLLPLAAVLICERTPQERQGRQLSILSLVYGVAFLVGIAGVPRLLSQGYAWLFVLEIVAAGLCLWWTPSGDVRAHASRFDSAGLGLWVLTLLLFAIASNSVGLSRTQSLVAAALGALALFGFHRVERGAQDAMLPPALWAERRALPLLFVAVGSGFGQALVVALPTLAAQKLGVRGERAIALLYPLIAGGLSAGLASALFLDRVGARSAASFGALACLASGAALAWGGDSTRWFLVATFTLGLGTSALSGGALRHAVSQSSAAHLLTRAQAALGLFTNVGVLIGGATFGALTSDATSPLDAARDVALVFLAAMTFAFIPVIRLPTRSSRGADPVV